MSAPRYRIVGCGFGERLQRLFTAWERSIEANCPGAELVVIEGEKPPRQPDRAATYTDNTYKLHVWREEVERAVRDGVRVACLDMDMVVLGDLSSVWEQMGTADVAVTERPGKYWLNGGAVYCRPTPAAAAFMDQWCRVNDALLADLRVLKAAVGRHYGLNQTALVHLLEAGEPCCELVRVPCQQWNCCDQVWAQFDDDVRVLHVKGQLREHLYAFHAVEKVRPEWRGAYEAILRYDPEAWRITGRAA